MKRRIAALLTAAVLLLGLLPSAQAAGLPDEAEAAARRLHSLGLFQGVGTLADGSPDFALANPLDRQQGVTLLVRLLGREAEAKAGSWAAPFTDVPDWALPYVGCAYESGLTRGVDETTFGATSPMDANQFATLLLRALGYDDANGDFAWNTAADFARSLGMTKGAYSGPFTRGDAAALSYAALFQKEQWEDTAPVMRLMERGAIQAAPLAGMDAPDFSADLLALGAAMPAVSPKNMPKWSGVSLSNKIEWTTPNLGGTTQLYREQDVIDLAGFGFNFIRVPLNFTLFFPDENDMGRVNYAHFYDVDRLVRWGMENGVHVCLDLHNMPGSDHKMADGDRVMFSTPEMQEMLVEFWRVFAQRYAGVPANALSFNIINEPPSWVSDEDYSALMLRCAQVIREGREDRLIFVDMLNFGTQPVYGLADAGVVQAFHIYTPHAFTHANLGSETRAHVSWPYTFLNGFIAQDIGPYTIQGNFQAGDRLDLHVQGFHLSGRLVLRADGKEVWAHDFPAPQAGVNGCVAVGEAGTAGEYGDYDLRLSVTLPGAAETLTLAPEGKGRWANLASVTLTAGGRALLLSSGDTPEGVDVNDLPNTVVTLAADGSVATPAGLNQYDVGKADLDAILTQYADFSRQTGTPVMLQEFGVLYAAPYGETKEYLTDLLDLVEAHDLNWCSWDYWGVFSFLADADGYCLREGAEYEPFHGYQLCRELLELYQRYQRK